MTVTAELLVSSPSLPFVSFAESLPSNQLECEHGLCHGGDSRVFVVHLDPADGVTEDDLIALDEVVGTTPLGREGDRDVYQLDVKLEDIVSEAFVPGRFAKAQIEPTTIIPGGWYEKKIFQNYESFNNMRNHCDEHGIRIDLISITQDSLSQDEHSQYGLTDRQYEALALAISHGYYDNPRQATAGDLAEEMGISQPSMSNLLRRGERQLITSTIGTQPSLTNPST
ncbi:helix-turn-helix domain-containing protein [Natrinema zhouii]|uniref:Helix-turn-helix domain-containing protein n=1 Tax=Natrinema zhouii TaxID=1710539 RepID=A0A7D6CMW5_9EURY|nr:helix-turn-helix domain-containing protein [Natrinema zhouii]QLK25395.1 helix-turn-helix domain-containing protein [Natrinema zhouii]